jgi:hypothetical protein
MAKTDRAFRYVVEWTPWADVAAAAGKLGWTEGESAADFVEVNDYRRTHRCSNFGTAVAFAREVTEADTWRCPLIHRQELVKHETDDMGNRVKPFLEWETDASWECAADDQPDESEPSFYSEAA